MNILTISQDMYRDFGLAFPMIPTTFLCLFLCPQQTILNSESHYEVTEAFSVGVGGSHSGSQELGHLKTVAFAGARLFEEHFGSRQRSLCRPPPSGSSKIHGTGHTELSLFSPSIWLLKKPRHFSRTCYHFNGS